MARIVVRSGEALPGICVVSGRPATHVVPWTFHREAAPWSLVLLVAGVLPYVVYRWAVRRSRVLELPVRRKVIERVDRYRLRAYRGIVLGGAVMLGGVLVGSTVVVAVGAAVLVTAHAAWRRVERREWVWGALADDGTVTIEGCHPAFVRAVEIRRRAPA